MNPRSFPNATTGHIAVAGQTIVAHRLENFHRRRKQLKGGYCPYKNGDDANGIILCLFCVSSFIVAYGFRKPPLHEERLIGGGFGHA